MQKPLWWIKLTRYEYWPVWLFFLPAIFIYWPVLALRARAFLYFTATNPGIPLGGFFGESKYDIIKSLPPQYLPKTLLIKPEDINNVLRLIEENGIGFPLIIKPDVGERGTKVVKADNAGELEAYLSQSTGDIIIQEYIAYPEEYGVLFYKYPDETVKGISSIVKKGFMYAEGDGKSTLRELLQKNNRARFQLKNFEADPKINLEEVLPNGVQKLLQPIGNHCKGTQFLNANHLVNNTMIEAFNKMAAAMPGFYFGRFDIKVPSEADLMAGENIRVMEVNGTTSEPGHIYDMQTMNLWTAQRDVWRNMKIVNTIAIINHRKCGVKHETLGNFFKTVYFHFFKRK